MFWKYCWCCSERTAALADVWCAMCKRAFSVIVLDLCQEEGKQLIVIDGRLLIYLFHNLPCLP
eukprot:1777218-Amphidinium_carterae.1